MTPRLACSGLTGGRGSSIVFRDLDLDLEAGRVLTLLGPNGAGKTTLLLTLAGLLPSKAGTVSIDGVALHGGRPNAASKAGIVLVPDDRCLFTTLTVEQNLEVASQRGGPSPKDMIATFPALEKRWKVSAGALSGGEQQMLVMARALIQQPKVLLVDEMSMGLAPLVVEQLFSTVREIATDHEAAIVLVEQHVNLALEVADEAIVLNRGTIVLHDEAEALRGDSRIEQAYFGDVDAADEAAVPS
ncbi:ABC transporter ATP-binding protein [Aquihabitans sp. McL0605]|uniref:ABC transporter ATP-binding protein n=1 Tax=Aquihabitans sp. McL0605 TaxID=3415671 RepID=UPI003CE792AD